MIERRRAIPSEYWLENGERMKQPEFHRRYRNRPDDRKIELIGGSVHMPSPVRQPHGAVHLMLGTVVGIYTASTLGTEGLDNTTIILGGESEPQPDLILRISSDYGGQSEIDEDDYVVGSPELVIEISHSTRSIDLNEKRQDYERAGITEYVVYAIEEEELHWWSLDQDEELRPNRKGIRKSEVLPGFWLAGAPIAERDTASLIEIMQQGLRSKEHKKFMRELSSRYSSE